MRGDKYGTKGEYHSIVGKEETCRIWRTRSRHRRLLCRLSNCNGVPNFNGGVAPLLSTLLLTTYLIECEKPMKTPSRIMNTWLYKKSLSIKGHGKATRLYLMPI